MVEVELRAALAGRWRPGRWRPARRNAGSRLRRVPVAELLATAAALLALERVHLVAPHPAWAYPTLLAVAAAAGVGADRVFPGASRREVHLRLAVHSATTTLVAYATGWGPLLAIGYMFPVGRAVEEGGATAAWPALGWSLGGIGAGQVAVATGLAPTLAPLPAVHGLAVLGALGLTVVVRALASATAGKEQAEAEVRRSERRFRSLVQHASDAISVVNRDEVVVYVSPAVERLLGYPPAAYLGMSGYEFLHPDDAPVHQQLERVRTAALGTVARGELRARHRDGRWRWLQVTITNLLDDPDVQGLVSNFRDITDRKRHEDDLARRADHDPLTGLANRAAFLAHLERAVARGRRQPRPLAVLFLDLDHFKAVNDRLGHETGDLLLVEVARRLATCLRAEDTLARMGGDEFTVLMEDMAGRGEAVQVAERFLASLGHPFLLGGHALTVSTSIGIVVSDGDEHAPGDLLRQADLAMYQAKARGRSCWQLVDPTARAVEPSGGRLPAR